MTVVLFCGGLGLRLREYSAQTPKPMVPVGRHPIIWHLMRYYAYFGHREFILCLGHKGAEIREALAREAAADAGAADWHLTFVDTGLGTTIGGRLMAVRHLLRDEPEFLANYTDTLSDVDPADVIHGARAVGAVGGFLAVRPNITSHIVTADHRGLVRHIGRAADAEIWANGGYFVFRREIFDYIREGEELVEAPFVRLAALDKLYAHQYRGYWTSMDTFKEKQQLDDLCARGAAPWEVWRHEARDLAGP